MTRTEYYCKLARTLANYNHYHDYNTTIKDVVETLTVHDLSRMAPKDQQIIMEFVKEYIV